MIGAVDAVAQMKRAHEDFMRGTSRYTEHEILEEQRPWEENDVFYSGKKRV